MKHRVCIIVCLTTAILPMGCQGPAKPRQDAVSVVAQGKGKFPPELAGTWKANREGWEMVIEPDGSVASAVISFGRVRIIPGKSQTLTTQGGGEGLFEPGPWTVHYDPKTNDLIVKIVMSHIRIEMAEAVLEGTGVDTFAGPISAADGVWQAQWTNFSRYLLHRPDGSVSELATDETYGETIALPFERLSAP